MDAVEARIKCFSHPPDRSPLASGVIALEYQNEPTLTESAAAHRLRDALLQLFQLLAIGVLIGPCLHIETR